MATAQLYLRDGIIDRLLKLHGFQSETGFARAIGVTQASLNRAASGGPVSAKVIAGISTTFGYGIGEVAEVRITSDDMQDAA